jgi:hypothetical protein
VSFAFFGCVCGAFCCAAYGAARLPCHKLPPKPTTPNTTAQPPLCHPFAARTHRHQISLYAHVAKLAFALDSVDAPVVRGTISDPGSGVVSALAIEPAAEDAFDVADRIWEAL